MRAVSRGDNESSRAEADVYLEDDLEERMSKSKRSHVHFCAEEFDDVGLFCHMDEEHRVELKNEVIISSSDL
ncbi:hypothetical protein KSS87_018325 [Heliosperma pusillum]|nr:hypothetical protein KSS87_018325 [Heliosperma pusillum]